MNDIPARTAEIVGAMPAEAALERAGLDGLPPLPGGWSERTLCLAGRTVAIAAPADPDGLLDCDEAVPDDADGDYLPYWARLWEAAPDLAETILQTPTAALPASRVLEIGCGLGLAGLAALLQGCDTTFSDYDPRAVAVAQFNARRYGFSPRGLRLDWRSPPPLRFDWIIASDVLYDRQDHGPLLALLDSTLPPRGQAWLTDPRRAQAEAFIDRARRRGYDCRCREKQNSRLWVLIRRGDDAPSLSPADRNSPA